MEIGIWGDSITYGGPTEGWVRLLRESLSDNETNVYNRGICGDTSEDIIKRFSVEANAIEPQIIIFAIGINDSKYPDGLNKNKVSYEKFKSNMQNLVKQAKVISARVILIGLTEVNENKIESNNKFTNHEIERYDKFLNELAQQDRLEFISMRSVLDKEKDLEDGLHPNPQGYAKMFEKIALSFK